jgi:hypothetical protein
MRHTVVLVGTVIAVLVLGFVAVWVLSATGSGHSGPVITTRVPTVRPTIVHFTVDGQDLPCVYWRGALSCDWRHVNG